MTEFEVLHFEVLPLNDLLQFEKLSPNLNLNQQIKIKK